MALREQQIDAGDININYLRDGSGPPPVLLHGWPEFCKTWKKNIPALAARFDVIAPDLRGFGGTRRRDGQPVESLTPDLLAQDLAALLDSLGIDRVGIVG